jgi:hypothetical protein
MIPILAFSPLPEAAQSEIHPCGAPLIAMSREYAYIGISLQF